MNDAITYEQVADLWARAKSEPEQAMAELNELSLDHRQDLPLEILLKVQAARARALTYMNKLTEAIAAAEITEKTLAAMPEPDVEIEFRMRRIRIRQAAQVNQRQKALDLVLENLELIRAQPKGSLYALAHSDVAAVYGGTGNFRMTLKHLQEGLNHTLSDDHALYGTLLNNLGNVYLPMKREEEALACFSKAREAFKKAGALPRKALAISNEGRALTALERFQESITKQQEALSIFRELELGHDEVATLYKLGDTHAHLGDAAAAEGHYQQAIARIHQGNADGYEDELRRAYGEFLTDEGRYREAVEQFEILLELTRDAGTIKQIGRNLRRYAVSLERVGETEAALAAYKELLALRDVIDQQTEQTDGQKDLPVLEETVEKDVTLLQATSRALAEANKLLAEQSRELAKLAITDELTGLHNRRYLTEQLDDAVQKATNQGEPFSVIFLDVDKFKDINDTYGHHVGDEVLKGLGYLLQEVVRGADFVGRWGGEEFAVLLVGADTTRARRVAERLNTAIANFAWGSIASDLRVTISAGVVSSENIDLTDTAELMHIADHLLYAAKDRGRNQTLFAADEPQTVANALR